MKILVMKFGGTSVGDLERIRAAASRVGDRVDEGYKVIVVVSAMAGRTNALIDLITSSADEADEQEYDAVVSSGENVTAGLMALALQACGINARSWQGWQVPLRTDNAHSVARIKAVETDAVLASFAQNMQVAVVAGFQGISPEGRITTLGRGGSDTTAVAFAAAFDAERCDIYTDVEGVFTTDPRLTRKAQRIDRITYEEMLELASLGAKVLQTRSVELAVRFKVRLRVLSSFCAEGGLNTGTLVCSEEEIMESKVVSGVAFSRDEAKLTLMSVADRPGVAGAIFTALAKAGVNVDMIVQNISEQGRTNMTFSCPIGQLERARAVVFQEEKKQEISFKDFIADDQVAKVSVVGIGMRSHAGVAAEMFDALAREGVNIQVIATSEIKISVLIERKYMELAVRTLHKAFGLDAEA